MKSIIAITLLTLSFYASASIDCNATINDANSDRPVNLTSSLKTTYNYNNFIKAETEIEDAYFSLNADLDNKSLSLTISFGPEYTSGLLSKGWFNRNGTFKTTRVEGERVYSLACSKN